jgi:CubicO group peptidase (beta-lactamase class C family)
MTGTAQRNTSFDLSHWCPRLGALADEYGVPGAALAVLVDGDVHELAAGVANRRTGVEATPDTLFQIGSITKVWTTTLLLTLVDDGMIDLDAPVRTYVPELVLRDEDVASRLSVRQLLNHTSGLPGDYFPDTGRGDDCLERYVAVLKDVELSHPLGALLSYSNAAFVLAGLVIERVTGTTWDAAMRTGLFEPLGLTRTVTLPEDALLHRTAVGHVGEARDVASQWTLPRNCGPAGLITARAHDVIAFARLHLDGGLSRAGTRILSEASVKAMQQLTVPMPGATQGWIGFGLGWGLARWSGTPVLQHDGGTIGQTAALRVFPERQIAIALLTNGGEWTGFRDAVLAELVPAIAGVQPAPSLVPGEQGAFDAAELVGVYRNIGAELTLTEKDGRLFATQLALDELEALATRETVEFELLPQGADLFLAKIPGMTTWMPIVFLRDRSGAVEYLHVAGRAARRQ